LQTHDPRRIRAGIEFTLQRGLDDGHVLLPRLAVIVSASELLGVDDTLVTESVDGMLETGALVEDVLGSEGGGVYLPSSEAEEAELARTIVTLIGTPSRLGRPEAHELQRVGNELAFDLDEGQVSALQLVLGRSIGVLTGGPGTGKTTIVRAAVAFARIRRMKVVLAAPTGRAAKRMSQATGMEAKTIHRLLEFDPRSGAFRCAADTPVDAELVIVDEASMLDQRLALALVAAVRPGTSLLLVGDSDQLPSVGAGDVLADIISSSCVPVARLERVFRQAGDSEIIACADSVKSGEVPTPSSAANGEYFFVECKSPEHAVERLVHIVRDRMPAAFQLSPLRDIQCLTPMNGGALGTRALNGALQAALSPGGANLAKGDRRLHVGDKVMQVRNNYDLEVYNGDIGVVRSLDVAEVSLTVDYEGRLVEYTGAVLDDLTLAYAVTVHKSQGSEFRAVVLVLTTHHFKLLQRNLLYTAITRARERLVIVGTKRALSMAIDDISGARRETRLTERLKALT
jgi:exodeoxyribonuclease V alpha subunit